MSTMEHFAVQDFFNQVFFFTFHKFRWWQKHWVVAHYQVSWHKSEFDNFEDQVKTFHWERQLEPVDIAGDLFFNCKWAKSTVGIVLIMGIPADFCIY